MEEIKNQKEKEKLEKKVNHVSYSEIKRKEERSLEKRMERMLKMKETEKMTRMRMMTMRKKLIMKT
jgi:hypothetical protein